MRKFQLTINLLSVDDGKKQEFAVYADANNVWEAVCAGVSELMSVIQDDIGLRLPSFGCKEHYKK